MINYVIPKIKMELLRKLKILLGISPRYSYNCEEIMILGADGHPIDSYESCEVTDNLTGKIR